MDERKQPPVSPAAPTAHALQDARTLQHQSERALSDILGSYTGTDAYGEAPEQDADDL